MTQLAPAIAALIFMLSQQALAHGVGDTGTHQPTEHPVSLWHWFLSDVDAAMHMRMDQSAGYRFIDADGLANHNTGRFPNRNNPNAIRAQNYKYRMPLEPRKSGQVTEVHHAAFGVASNGVPFDAATAEFWNNDRRADWNIEALTGTLNLGLDSNNAHVQPNGAYHYHGLPTGLLKLEDYQSKPTLIGYAADGFAIYAHYGYRAASAPDSGLKELRSSYRLKAGARPSGPGGTYDGRYTRDWEYREGSGDLDQCNGRSGVTPEYPNGRYYYVITDQFPFIPRCWVGEPDDSFQKGPPMGAGGRGGRGAGTEITAGGRRGGPPAEARDACLSRSAGDHCSFIAPFGPISGQCRDVREGLMCVPENHRHGPGLLF